MNTLGQYIGDLREVRTEITRLNEAAGYTVFNPAATQALEGVIRALRNGDLSPEVQDATEYLKWHGFENAETVAQLKAWIKEYML